jgi:hypothetical protein
MKYLKEGEKGKRTSKTNLTKGAFGLVGNKKFHSKLWKKYGVEFELQTKKGTGNTVYTPRKIKKNKYVPNSRGKVKNVKFIS